MHIHLINSLHLLWTSEKISDFSCPSTVPPRDEDPYMFPKSGSDQSINELRFRINQARMNTPYPGSFRFEHNFLYPGAQFHFIPYGSLSLGGTVQRL